MGNPLTPIPVVHADDDILVVDKPSGLLTIPGRSPDKADCLWTRLRDQFPGREVLLVHRLDRDTTGLIVFAFNRKAQTALHHSFERRQVHKEYFAVVHGQPDADAGTVDAPLRKDWTRNDPPVYIVDPERGKKAFTRWEVAWRRGDRAGMRLYPQTGRSHQLRVHMLHLGHPIVGDPIYAPPNPNEGLQLRSTLLAFDHPANGQRVSFGHPS